MKQNNTIMGVISVIQPRGKQEYSILEVFKLDWLSWIKIVWTKKETRFDWLT